MTTAQDEYDDLFRDKAHRSSHPEDYDNDDAASFLDDPSDRDSENTPNASTADVSSIPTSSTSDGHGNGKSFGHGHKGSYSIPRQRQDANTGPKGVIADAQAFRDARKSLRSSINASRSTLHHPALLDTGSPSDGKEGRHWTDGSGYDASLLEEDDDVHEDVLEDMDDGFLDQWRNNRLHQLQNQGSARIVGSPGRERVAAQSRYGSLLTVDGEGYLDAVDGSGSVTVVVVLIYDDMSEISHMVEECISILARKYRSTRFIKLHFEDAEMEPAGVPAVLAYRGGDKFAGLVPVVDEIPDDADLSAATLEVLFQRHQIL